MTERERKIIDLARVVATRSKDYEDAEEELPVVPEDDDDSFMGRYQGGPADDNDPSDAIDAGVELYNLFYGED